MGHTVGFELGELASVGCLDNVVRLSRRRQFITVDKSDTSRSFVSQNHITAPVCRLLSFRRVHVFIKGCKRKQLGPRVLCISAFRAWGVIQSAYALTSGQQRADRAGDKAATTIRAYVAQHVVHALHTERAFIAADTGTIVFGS